MSTPTLKLGTIERTPVEIGVDRYELAIPGDLSLSQHQDLARWWQRICWLEAIECDRCPGEGVEAAEACPHGVVTEADQREYEALNLRLAQMLLPDGAGALAELQTEDGKPRTDLHQAVVMSFFAGAIRSDPAGKWLLMTLLPLAMTEGRRKAKASGESSPISSGTTRERTPSSG